ncbi:unnamed protein product [Adineta ricciae]|uniref:Signal peptide peptidase-like 2B n=2 Tax=Adineta ricciae TaxID=249248 RepID=A0A814EQK0_ADIRI|nr:unnamed protein product [Adineta ricciae]CAF1170707.1 unnamed protein product [Adineta ricciae]
MTQIINFVFLLLCCPFVQTYTDGAINLLVRSSTSSEYYRYCIELAKLPNGQTVNVSDFGWYNPYLVSSTVDACNAASLNTSLPNTLSSRTMLIIYEHGCTMTEQAWNVEQLYGQIALMIITDRQDTSYELTYNTTTMPVSIPVMMFLDSDFDHLKNRFEDLNSIQLSIDYPVDVGRKFRPAVLLMFLLVLVVLLCGNFWAGDEFKRIMKERDSDNCSQLSSANSSPRVDETAPVQVITKENSPRPNEDLEEKKLAILPMTCCFIILMIFFAVGWLLLLYYFPQVMIYVLQAMFCISAFSSLIRCFNRLSYFVPILRRYEIPSCTLRRPCIWKLGPLNCITILAICVSLTLVIIWFIYRQRDWAWILQDILGAAVCISVTSIYRLGNMRVITVILVAFFLYDTFFVFITPYIPIFQKSSTSSSATTVAPSGSGSSVRSITRKSTRTPSVMEQVALGIGANGETVPLLFALPMFIPESEIDPCVTVRKSMLGFGDIILPGILLTFCKIYDIASANRWPVYYLQSLIAYFVGLALTHVALYLMNTAQPALLYIVPCILLSTITTSLIRRELKELFTGKRLELALEGKKQKPLAPLDNGLSNSIEEIIDNPNDHRYNELENPSESRLSDTDSVIIMNEPTGINPNVYL